MTSMKIHFAVMRENQWGGHNCWTLCGREHSQSEDGVNSSGNWGEVTCKFCLKQRDIHEKRELMRAAKPPHQA